MVLDGQRGVVRQIAVPRFVNRPRPFQREVERVRIDRAADDQALRPGAVAEDGCQCAADIAPHVDRGGETGACVTRRKLEVGLNRLILVADPQPERSGAVAGQVVPEREHRLVRGRIVGNARGQLYPVVPRIRRVLRDEQLVEVRILGRFRRIQEVVLVEVDLDHVPQLT